MGIKPVKFYDHPQYPDKLEVLNHPELLKSLPERWKSSSRTLIALSALLGLMLGGCKPSTDAVLDPDKENDGKSGGENTRRVEWIAPIFEHGDGRGSFGCVSVAPPAFLSEEEALDVIRAEAESMGIILGAEILKFENVRIPETKFYLSEKNKVDSSKKGDLVLDGYDDSKNIAVEFVSQDDYSNWRVKEGVESSVSDYDFLSAAKILRDGLDGKVRDYVVGVFYDPMPELTEEEIWDESISFEEKEAMLKERSKELLRNQVRDFLEWLKGQGII